MSRPCAASFPSKEEPFTMRLRVKQTSSMDRRVGSKKKKYHAKGDLKERRLASGQIRRDPEKLEKPDSMKLKKFSMAGWILD